MNIYVVELLGTGGMIHYAYQLCTALRQQGAEVTLVTTRNYELLDHPHNFTVEPRVQLWPMFDNSSGQLAQGRLAKLQRKLFWTVRRLLRGVQLIVEWIKLTHYLAKQKPDLVQFGKINFPFESIFLRYLRWRGLTLTQICHEFELREQSGTLKSTIANTLYASIYGNFAASFFLAESVRQRFLQLFAVPAGTTHVIPMGNEAMFLPETAVPSATSLRQRYGIDPETAVVLFFGTITPSKGVPSLIRAFARLPKEVNAHLLVAGFASKYVDPDELLQMTREVGIADRVSFDFRYLPNEEIPGLMQMARVVAFPYLNSTQSAALQMAYAFGKPVVTTTVGGLPEAVDEGRSGFLVPPDSPPELAKALHKLLSDKQLADKMGEHAKHLSETKFAWEPIAERITAVYAKLLATEPSATPKSTTKQSVPL